MRDRKITNTPRFEIRVAAVNHTTAIHGVDSVPSTKYSYELHFYDESGKLLGTATLARLRGKNWYEDSGRLVSDADLTSRERRALLKDVQTKAMYAPHREVLQITSNGFTYYRKKAFYVFHGRLLWPPQNRGTVEAAVKPSAPSHVPSLPRNELPFLVAKLLTLDEDCAAALFFISLIGPMKSILKWSNCQVEFMTCLYGPSGYMKTKRAQLYFDLFDNCDSLKTLSERRLLSKMTQMRDQNYLIDDLHPQASSYQKARQANQIDSIVRSSEREAAGPNVVLTAEFLTGPFSVQDRQLQIAVKGRCDSSKYSYLLNNREKIIAVHEYFIQSVMSHLPKVRSEIQNWANEHSCMYDYRCHHARDAILLMRSLFSRFCLTENECSVLKYELGLLDGQLDRIISEQVIHLSHMQRSNDASSDAAVMMWNMFNEQLIPMVSNEGEYRGSKKALLLNSKLYLPLANLVEAMCKYTGENPPRYRTLVKGLREQNFLSSIKEFHGHHCYVIDMEMLRDYCDSIRPQEA